MDQFGDDREHARLDRQFRQFEHSFPRFAGILNRLRSPGWRLVRVPIGVLFILGGFAAILPMFGLWMIPFGLALLAIDVHMLRRPVSALIIHVRRWNDVRRQKRR